MAETRGSTEQPVNTQEVGAWNDTEKKYTGNASLTP